MTNKRQSTHDRQQRNNKENQHKKKRHAKGTKMIAIWRFEKYKSCPNNYKELLI
jgi:hypothetical protein